ncbi:hypothetical protein [Rhizobium sp. Leaf262]|uniref:hypothetical protein n=1 Tax=Rhizobium sp. Leaf262 TaxID=1736312 RepID=UPI000712FF2C|nr:hypothetical protein [Rhizobium sp. Leaf262]KQO79774.1 hypothetical protein ASF29_22250 [Rhizobium sp. Leaf262]
MQSTHHNAKPKINLWVYNHPAFGISDQVAFFVSAFEQNGYEVDVSDRPNNAALNVVIENFAPHTKRVLMEFCNENSARVAVIMTEHIDFVGWKILIHGDPLWSQNDYMQPTTQVTRLRNLIALQPYLKCFFVLGDLPELQNIDEMILDVEVHKIPFPTMPVVQIEGRPPDCDLLFTGVLTDYRQSFLTGLSAMGLVIQSPPGFVSHEKRDEMNEQSKLVLNIPQRRSWRWLSSMRILAALRCGRATVSLGTNDTCEMAKCTYQIDIEKEDWRELLRSYVGDWRGLYERAHADYTAMAVDFERRHPFPHDMVEYWAITDRLSGKATA